jgi:hypothetical protein
MVAASTCQPSKPHHHMALLYEIPQDRERNGDYSLPSRASTKSPGQFHAQYYSDWKPQRTATSENFGSGGLWMRHNSRDIHTTVEESKHGACMELVGRAFFRQDLSRMRDISDTLFLGGVLLVGTLPFLRLWGCQLIWFRSDANYPCKALR